MFLWIDFALALRFLGAVTRGNFVEYRHVLDPDRKEEICLRILHALPAWFGDWKAARQYAKNTRAQFFLCALEDEEPIGFLAAEEHTDAACEIAVMGVLPEYHRQGIGCTLLRLCAHSYVARGYRYLTVKTLADTVGSASHVKTRAFYLACGFEPLEIFETLWNEENPCLYLVKPLFDGQGTKPMEF